MEVVLAFHFNSRYESFFESCYWFQKLKDQFKLSVTRVLFVFSKGSVFPCSFSNSLLYTNKEILIPTMPKILLGKAVSKRSTFHLSAIYFTTRKKIFSSFSQSIKSWISAFSLYVKAMGFSNKVIMEHFRYAFERQSSSSLLFFDFEEQYKITNTILQLLAHF